MKCVRYEIPEQEEASTGVVDEGDKFIIKKAGEVINADRVLVLIGDEVFLFDPTNSSHYGKVVGISNNAAVAAQDVRIVDSSVVPVGTVLVPGDIYYGGIGGVLTTTPPILGVLQRIGQACGTGEILVDIYIPVHKI